MVEYREHLKFTLSIAGGFAQVTVPTGITSIVQQFNSKFASMNALVIHEIRVQLPTAFAQTDNIKWHLSTKTETAVKKIADVGVIDAHDLKAGTAVGSPVGTDLTISEKLYPNELISSSNLYFAADSSDTGTIDVDIIYSIRKVSQQQFINNMLPSQV